MASSPLKAFWPDNSQGGLCASLNKHGEPCRCRQVRIAKRSGKPRCKYHGGNGKQTGPKTDAGKLKAWANLTGPKTKQGRIKANRSLLLSSRRNPKLKGRRKEPTALPTWISGRQKA